MSNNTKDLNSKLTSTESNSLKSVDDTTISTEEFMEMLNKAIERHHQSEDKAFIKANHYPRSKKLRDFL